VLDIVANVNGERKEYKEIPVNNAIADFGPNTFVLSDSKDSLTNYLKAKLQESENIVNSRSVHEALIPQYKQALGELNPEIANDNAVKELRGQVESMQNQLAEALALLRQKAANPTV
jgi:small-conductance mechanosensitive channel